MFVIGFLDSADDNIEKVAVSVMTAGLMCISYEVKNRISNK